MARRTRIRARLRRNRAVGTTVVLLAGIGVLLGTTGSANAEPSAGDWAELRACESGGNYAVNTGNGYYGAYQFDLGTWRSVGGTGLPSDASPATQDALAYKLWQQRGWAPWACASIVGLPEGGSGGPAVVAPTVAPKPVVRQVGRLDAVRASGDGAHVTVAGWAVDTNAQLRSSTVRITVDGGATLVRANVSRPDVNAGLHIVGPHGYQAAIAAWAGRHQVCATILSVSGSPNVSLGCRAVDVSAAVRTGTSVKRINGGQVVVSGWAYDNTAPSRSTYVIVRLNGVSRWVLAAAPSPAVNAAYKIPGNHQFRATFTIHAGRNTVCLTAVGVTASRLRSLGCSVFYVVVPRGAIEQSRVSGGQVYVAGWGYDPNAPGASVPIRIVVNGTSHLVPTHGWRPDINTRFHIAGHHGYTAGVPIRKGANTVCVYTMGSASVSAALQSCRTVTA